GTDFIDYYDALEGGAAQTTYWNTSDTTTFGSAKSYVPETPWDDSCANALLYGVEGYSQSYGTTGFCNSTTGKSFRSTEAGSGGPSIYSSQPTWQTGVVGLPNK